MKKFIRDNPTIAFGLGLPLVLVVVFLLISGIPNVVVDDPQYDLLFASQYNNYSNGIQISVVRNRVQVVYLGSTYINQRPRIWRYNPKSGAVKEIAYVLPPGLTPPNPSAPVSTTPTNNIVIEVPDLDGVNVDSSSIAPDGYEFNTGNNRYSGNVFGGLFYSSRYRNDAVLIKHGRQVRVPNPDGQYYGYNNHFIGWVVPE